MSSKRILMHDAAGQPLHDYHEQETEFNQMRLDRKKAEAQETYTIDQDTKNLMAMIQYLFDEQLKCLSEKKRAHEYHNNKQSLALYDAQLTQLVTVKYNRQNLLSVKPSQGEDEKEYHETPTRTTLEEAVEYLKNKLMTNRKTYQHSQAYIDKHNKL